MENSEEFRLAQSERERGQQGIHEVEISFGGESDLHKLFKRCKKNPGHEQFISLYDLNLNNLPNGLCNLKTLLTVCQLASRTVKLSVKYISAERPPWFHLGHLAGISLLSVGSGYVTEIPKSEDKEELPCPFTDCQEHPGPHTVYGYITVVTAAHVVFDVEEVKNTTVEFFFDSEDKSGVITARGLRVGAACKNGDFCEMVCVTHDPVLFQEAHCVSVPSYLLPLRSKLPALSQLFHENVTFKEIKQPLVKFSIHCICKLKAITADNEESVNLTNSDDLKNFREKLRIKRNAKTKQVKGRSLSCQHFNSNVSFEMNFLHTLLKEELLIKESSVNGNTITFHLPIHIRSDELLILLLCDVPTIRKAINIYLDMVTHKTDESSIRELMNILSALCNNWEKKILLDRTRLMLTAYPLHIFYIFLRLKQLLLTRRTTTFNRLRLWDVDDETITVTVTYYDDDTELCWLPNPRSAECPKCEHIICVCPIMCSSEKDFFDKIVSLGIFHTLNSYTEIFAAHCDPNKIEPQTIKIKKILRLKNDEQLLCIKQSISDFNVRISVLKMISFLSIHKDTIQQHCCELQGIINDMFQDLITCLHNMPTTTEQENSLQSIDIIFKTSKLTSGGTNLSAIYDVCTLLQQYVCKYDSYHKLNTFDEDNKFSEKLEYICRDLPLQLDFHFKKIKDDCLKNFNILKQEKMSPEEEARADSLVIHISHPHGQSKHVTIGELTKCWTGYGHYHPLYTADTCPGSSGGPTWVMTRDSLKKVYGFTHSGCDVRLNRGSAWTLYPGEESQLNL